ncbi:MAG: membrane protein insertion efficiency factor YidD [Micromonosporaceae bacterium]
MTDQPPDPPDERPQDDGPPRHAKPRWYVRWGPVGWSVAFASAAALGMLVVVVVMALVPRGRLGCGTRTGQQGGSPSPSGTPDQTGTPAGTGAQPCGDGCDDACDDAVNGLVDMTCGSLGGCGGSGGSDPDDRDPAKGGSSGGAPTGGAPTGGGTDGGGSGSGGSGCGGSGSGGSGGGSSCGSSGGGDCSGHVVPPGHQSYADLLAALPTLVTTQATLTRATPTPAARAGVAAIRAYQRWVSPRLAVRCRYTPTCSQYGLQAIQRYGLGLGARLAYARVRRCTHRVPYGTPDPVPMTSG